MGWVERAGELAEQDAAIGMSTDLARLMEKYGEEEGIYLYGELMSYKRSYRKLTFIRTGLERDGNFRELAEAEAKEKGWEFEEIQGSLELFGRLLGGAWGREFLVTPPCYKVVASWDDQIVRAIGPQEVSKQQPDNSGWDCSA